MLGGKVTVVNPLEINEDLGIYMGTPNGGMTSHTIKNIKFNKDIITDPKSEFKHNLIFGTTGKGKKRKTFTEMEFKQELAPGNANIKHIEINGEKVVIMVYPV